MSDNVIIRNIEKPDSSVIAELNSAAVPNVNLLEEPALYSLVESAAYARVADIDGDVVGLMVAFGPGSSYQSLNYRWFDDRYGDFLYVDRIVVSEAARGRGIGKKLYDDLSAFAEGRSSCLACEVNERPPNPGSMRFHERLGFRIVGRQETDGGSKSVALMLKTFS